MRTTTLALLATFLASCASEPASVRTARATPASSTSSASVARVEIPTLASSTSVVASASASSARATLKRVVVHVFPLGDVSTDTVNAAAEALRAHAPLDVYVEKPVSIPTLAKTAEKNRFSADRLLEYLDGLPLTSRAGVSTNKAKVVGVTQHDIVTPKNGVPNWGILGLGSLDGKSCVFSTYRMKRAFEKGGGASEELVRERLWKVALHELGHTLGLDHCPNAGCIMEDAKGTVKTVDGESALCERCTRLMKEAVDRVGE